MPRASLAGRGSGARAGSVPRGLRAAGLFAPRSGARRLKPRLRYAALAAFALGLAQRHDRVRLVRLGLVPAGRAAGGRAQGTARGPRAVQLPLQRLLSPLRGHLRAAAAAAGGRGGAAAGRDRAGGCGHDTQEQALDGSYTLDDVVSQDNPSRFLTLIQGPMAGSYRGFQQRAAVRERGHGAGGQRQPVPAQPGRRGCGGRYSSRRPRLRRSRPTCCRCGAGCRQRIVLHNLDATPARGRPGSCPICTRPQSTAHNTPDGDQFLLSSPGLISFATGAPARRHGSPYQIDPLSHTIRHETVRFKTVTI